MSAPLVGADGAPISSAGQASQPPRIARGQASPFPQLHGLGLQRVKVQPGAPDVFRLTFAMRTTLSGKGSAFGLDLPLTLRARPLAGYLRNLADALDALADHHELVSDDTATKPADKAQTGETLTAQQDSAASVGGHIAGNDQ